MLRYAIDSNIFRQFLGAYFYNRFNDKHIFFSANISREINQLYEYAVNYKCVQLYLPPTCLNEIKKGMHFHGRTYEEFMPFISENFSILPESDPKVVAKFYNKYISHTPQMFYNYKLNKDAMILAECAAVKMPTPITEVEPEFDENNGEEYRGIKIITADADFFLTSKSGKNQRYYEYMNSVMRGEPDINYSKCILGEIAKINTENNSVCFPVFPTAVLEEIEKCVSCRSEEDIKKEPESLLFFRNKEQLSPDTFLSYDENLFILPQDNDSNDKSVDFENVTM